MTGNGALAPSFLLRLLHRLAAAAVLLLASTLVWGQALLPVPELRARAMDQTGTLDAAALAALEARLAAFEQERGTQVVVLMVPTTAPEDIADYTQRLGDAWKIGRRDVGDGVLFVIAKDDRRLRIATAKTLEGAIPDLLARRIIDQAVTPAFRQGDFVGGINAGVDQILARVRGEDLPLPGDTTGAVAGDLSWPDLLIFLAFAVPMIAAVLRSIFGNKLGTLLTGVGAGGLAFALTAVLWIAIGGRGGGFGGGGAFSSGGGGNFGGGGASGGW